MGLNLRWLVYRLNCGRRGTYRAGMSQEPPRIWIVTVARFTGLLVLTLNSLADGVETRRTQVGDVNRITSSRSFSGWNQTGPTDPNKDAKRVDFSGQSNVVFRERILPSRMGSALRLFRVYDSVENSRRIDQTEDKASLRRAVRRILLDPEPGGYLLYSPDAKLQFPELAMFDDHFHLPALEEILDPGELTIGKTWNATAIALGEFTGVDSVESGQVKCKVEGVVPLVGKDYLQISAMGAFLGRAGPLRVRCNVRGGMYVDPNSGRLISIRVMGQQETLGEKDDVVASMEVDYQVLVEPITGDVELSDEAVAKLPAQPPEEALLLAFESVAPQVRFDHHRRWLLQRIEPGRLFFAGPEVSFVVTVEPEGKCPSIDEYFRQVQEHLAKEKLEASLARPARETKSEAGRIGHFRFEAALNQRPSILDYWVVERNGRGATIAVNAAKSVAKELLAEVEAIVRHMTFTKPIAGDTK